MSSHYESAAQALKDKVRLVQDFPEEGILFEDLTPVLADPEAFRTVVDGLAAACEELGADMIGGLDARGFLLGSAVAYKMGLGILAIRKKGKLPHRYIPRNMSWSMAPRRWRFQPAALTSRANA